MTKLIAPIAAILLSMVLLTALTLRAEEKAAAPDADRFKGRIVLVIIDQSNSLDEQNRTEFLKDAKIEKIGGRHFITGTVQLSARDRDDSRQDWRDGANVGIPISKVGAYYAYTPERFEEVYQALSDDEQ